VKVRDDRFRHLLCPCSSVMARRGDCGEHGRPDAVAPAGRHHSHAVNRWLGKSVLGSGAPVPGILAASLPDGIGRRG
jgi:hypothetical protein